nr:hypothetical protein [Tanacetum cinerariifolium]
MLVPAVVAEGEGSGTHTEPQPTPSPTQPRVGYQPHTTESSSRPENTQHSRTTLEGTGGSEGDQVLDLLKHKDAQAAEILKLKTRIKKLEKKCKPNISHYTAWLMSVSSLLGKKKLGKKESVSKQGRKNAKPVPTLDDSPFDDLDVDLAHAAALVLMVLVHGGTNELKKYTRTMNPTTQTVAAMKNSSVSMPFPGGGGESG